MSAAIVCIALSSSFTHHTKHLASRETESRCLGSKTLIDLLLMYRSTSFLRIIVSHFFNESIYISDYCLYSTVFCDPGVHQKHACCTPDVALSLCWSLLGQWCCGCGSDGRWPVGSSTHSLLSCYSLATLVTGGGLPPGNGEIRKVKWQLETQIKGISRVRYKEFSRMSMSHLFTF